METCSKLAGLEQISFNSVLRCSSVSGLWEVVCPEPRNATRVPSKRNFPYRNSDPNLDVISLFLDMDDLENELDVYNGHLGLLNCSPPVRTSNPLVQDAHFTQYQTSIIGSLTRNTQGAKASSRGNDASEKPERRIEGFSCGGGSKSHCISASA